MLNHPGLNQFQRNQKSVQDKNGSKKNTKNQGSNGKNRGNKSAKSGKIKNSKKQRKGRKNNRKPAKKFIPPEPSVPDLPLNIEQLRKKSLKSQNERKSKQVISIPNGVPISEYLPPPPPQIELGLVPFINGFFETTTIVSNIVVLSFPSIISSPTCLHLTIFFLFTFQSPTTTTMDSTTTITLPETTTTLSLEEEKLLFADSITTTAATTTTMTADTTTTMTADDMTTTTALPQMDFADTITTTTTATTTTAETTTIYTTTSVDISDLARGDFENEGKNIE